MLKNISIRRGIIVICSIALLSLLSSKEAVPPAFAYSCGDASNGHCYGEVQWKNTASGQFNGASTEIDVVPLKCSGCSSYIVGDQERCPLIGNCSFINNEMWLVDDNTSRCPQKCWVEAGYMT